MVQGLAGRLGAAGRCSNACGLRTCAAAGLITCCSCVVACRKPIWFQGVKRAFKLQVTAQTGPGIL